MRLDTADPAVPFLVNFAVDRTSEREIQGQYSPEMHVWTVETPSGPTPIVNADTSLLEMLTKTAVNQERDDEISRGMLPEFVTKTDVKQESDDTSWSLDLLELETKTEAQLEHDDRSDPIT